MAHSTPISVKFGFLKKEGKLGKSLVVCWICKTVIKFTGSTIVTLTWRDGVMKCIQALRSNYVDASPQENTRVRYYYQTVSPASTL